MINFSPSLVPWPPLAELPVDVQAYMDQGMAYAMDLAGHMKRLAQREANRQPSYVDAWGALTGDTFLMLAVLDPHGEALVGLIAALAMQAAGIEPPS